MPIDLSSPAGQPPGGFTEIVAAESHGTRPDIAARMPQFVGYRGDAAKGRGDAAKGLGSLRVMLVGCGSVGRAAAVHFARMQVAEIRLVDPGCYDPENLLTQPITPDDLGQPKASSTGRLLKWLSPSTRVLACDGRVESLDPSDYLGLSCVLLAIDNLSGEIEVGCRCHALGVPLIQAAVDGSTLLAQVRLWNHDRAEAACLACQFGPAEWSALDAERRFRCGGPTAGEAATVSRPTMSLAPLCSLAADLAVLRAVRLALKLGRREPDSMIEHCAFTNRSVTSPLARNPECRIDHRRWRAVAAARPLAECSAAELFELAGLDGVAPAAGLSVSGSHFVERAVCARCQARQRVRRFVPVSAAIPCLHCGGPAAADRFRSYRTVSFRRLGGEAVRPLALLGAGFDTDADGPRSVILHSGPDTVLVYRPRSPR
jgi:molybdopterin/thiamine biosynthesis adenylyltransferase